MRNNIFFALLITICAFSLQVHAQSKHQVGIHTSLFPSRYGTLNNTTFAHHRYGLEYQYQVKDHWQLRLALSLASQDIDERNDLVADGYQGTISLNEKLGILGINYLFNPQSKLTWLAGIDVFAGQYNNSGEFTGGFDGKGYSYNEEWTAIGATIKTGAQYQIGKHFILRATSCLQSFNLFREVEGGEGSKSRMPWIPLKLAFSYEF